MEVEQVKWRKHVGWSFVLAGVLIINMVLIDWYLVKKNSEKGMVATVTEVMVDKDCDEECVKRIVESQLGAIEPTKEVGEVPLPTATLVILEPKVVAKNPERVKYVVLASGSVTGTDWMRLSLTEKWLNTSLHGELVSASWEGWLEISGGSGSAYARLYDATNGRMVDGSLVEKSGGGKTSFYSSPISIWRGQNQYYVEMKSTSGSEVSITGARLRLVVK